jgi:16S rRNA (guanine1207-N2)-methyltransferase
VGGGSLSQAVYGWPPSSLAEVSDAAIQLSPFDPRAVALGEIADGELASAVIAAPPGAVERRFVLAHALRALQAGGLLTVLAPKNRGGSRLAAELRWFGCDPAEDARRHYRICRCSKPAAAENLDAAISLGRLQIAPSLGLWSQPGVFSWDRLDKGSAALLERGLAFNGDGADLGCGVGVLAREVLAGPGVARLLLVDIDARAIAAARLNVGDPRASFAHADVRNLSVLPADLDFVVMNPPFHHEGRQSLPLGQQFIAAAAAALRKGGLCRMVANAGLPYEVSLARAFSAVVQLARGEGYKIFEAIK